MAGYSHVTLEERERIAFFREEGRSQRVIAAVFGRLPSTISPELKRNCNADGTYRASTAERRYLARRRRVPLLDREPGLAAFVVERLHENWTPEQIAG